MANKSLGDTTKRQIKLYKKDLDTLQAYYPTVGYNHVVRELVRKHCAALRAAANNSPAISTESLLPPENFLDLIED